MRKKIVSILLTAVVLVTVLSSCTAAGDTGDEAEEETDNSVEIVTDAEDTITTDDSTFKLSYTQSDSLDPYSSTTQNNIIVEQLVYEGLFTLDDNFNATPNIASGYEYTATNMIRVTVNSGIKFSNGDYITADDVVRSFSNAKSSDYWGNIIEGISSCSKESESVVNFALKRANPYAQNLLIFPITAKEKSSKGFYIGSGKYYFTKENGETILKANKENGYSPYITKIHLENITSSSSIDNAVNIGNISFAFRDLSSDSDKKMSAGKKLVNMNNLVYIGINCKRKTTSDANIRKAISYAVDREALVKSAYGSFAAVATSVFNPQFQLSETSLFSLEADTASARQAILNSKYKSPKLELLVNNDNADRVTAAKLVKQQLEAAGFKVTVKSVSYKKYVSLIKKGSFDIYIGEIKLPYDMSLSEFFEKGGSASYGIDTGSKTAKYYNNFLEGDMEVSEFLLEFADEMPYVPLLYRKGMVCFSKVMSGEVQSTYTDCFVNMEKWNFS